MTLRGLLFNAKGLDTKQQWKLSLDSSLKGLKKGSEKRQKFSTKTTPGTNRAFQGEKKKIRKWGSVGDYSWSIWIWKGQGLRPYHPERAQSRLKRAGLSLIESCLHMNWLLVFPFDCHSNLLSDHLLNLQIPLLSIQSSKISSPHILSDGVLTDT